MRSLADYQASFARAILTPQSPIPPGLAGRDGRAATDRFGIYRNNVAVGLTGALVDTFPVVQQLVGKDFFAAMARDFVLARPPVSPVLLDYGAGFADFVAEFEPARPVPYLADVARMEWAWVESYHATDAVPISTEYLATLPSRALPNAVLTLHPSVRIVRSDFPVLSIWRHHHEEVGGPLELTEAREDALFTRPYTVVEALLLPTGGAMFVEIIRAGRTVVDAAETVVGVVPGFDLAGLLAILLECGALARVAVPHDKWEAPSGTVP